MQFPSNHLCLFCNSPFLGYTLILSKCKLCSKEIPGVSQCKECSIKHKLCMICGKDIDTKYDKEKVLRWLEKEYKFLDHNGKGNEDAIEFLEAKIARGEKINGDMKSYYETRNAYNSFRQHLNSIKILCDDQYAISIASVPNPNLYMEWCKTHKTIHVCENCMSREYNTEEMNDGTHLCYKCIDEFENGISGM